MPKIKTAQQLRYFSLLQNVIGFSPRSDVNILSSKVIINNKQIIRNTMSTCQVIIISSNKQSTKSFEMIILEFRKIVKLCLQIIHNFKGTLFPFQKKKHNHVGENEGGKFSVGNVLTFSAPLIKK